jgi:hypothetical protein
MAYKERATQRALINARNRALTRLRQTHDEEFRILFAEEMTAEGYVHTGKDAFHGGGWIKANGLPSGQRRHLVDKGAT